MPDDERRQSSVIPAIELLMAIERHLGTQSFLDLALSALNDGVERDYVRGWQVRREIGELSWFQGSDVPTKWSTRSIIHAW